MNNSCFKKYFIKGLIAAIAIMASDITFSMQNPFGHRKSPRKSKKNEVKNTVIQKSEPNRCEIQHKSEIQLKDEESKSEGHKVIFKPMSFENHSTKTNDIIPSVLDTGNKETDTMSAALSYYKNSSSNISPTRRGSMMLPSRIRSVPTVSPQKTVKTTQRSSTGFYIPIVKIYRRMEEAEYRKLIDSFISISFNIKYDSTLKKFKVIFPFYKYQPLLPFSELDFKTYKKVILEAYGSVRLKPSDEIVPEDPAYHLFGYINYINNTQLNNIPEEQWPSQKYKKAVLDAFYASDTDKLKVLLN